MTDTNLTVESKDRVARMILSLCIKHIKDFSDNLTDAALNGIYKDNTCAEAYKSGLADAIEIINIALKGCEKRLNEHDPINR